ncbi:E3 SUMO-protein ligase ZBED1 isoform X3 [Engystomops pustulosus]|uniref:E3 SUMO-protein ligase ZBED1 isoform X3 n=1 Tax=Engystomops pustulosus TaxID=76066 RepID=UPI003AFAC37F
MEAKNIDVPQPDLKLVAHPRAKSKVWKYFGFDTNAEGCIMQWKKIYCRICMAQIAYSGNTSNLSYHLEKNHPDEFCEFVKSNTEQMREAFATAFSKLKPEASQQVVQETFILKSNHTFDKKQLEVSSAVVNLICEVLSQQDGKVAIITGGAKGIGYYTAKHLARLGMHVIIAGNNETDGNEAVTRIQQDTLNEKVEFLFCDLASMKSIRNCVQNFKAKNLDLHVLVNNAGVMLVPEGRTEDGFEEHFGTNYLGHFLLTNLLLDTLRKSGTNYLNARVVTVSSATHFRGQVNFDDLQSSCYSAHGAYAQSKLALVLFTYYLQHLLTVEGSHVTCNAVDPGVVNTDLYKNLSYPGKVVKWMTGWLLLKSAEEGAATSIYACVSPDLEGIGGCYLYNGKRIDSSEVSYNLELQKKLWTESCKMAALPVSS